MRLRFRQMAHIWPQGAMTGPFACGTSGSPTPRQWYSKVTKTSCIRWPFSPDGTWLLLSGSFDDTLRVWDLRQSNAPALVFTGHKADVNAVAFSADGDRLASGSDDRTIRVWNSRRPDALPIVLEGRGDTVYSVAFSPDGTLLASGSFDDTARLWDLNQGPDALPVVIGGHRLDVNSVAFSPDGKRLASGSDDMTIRIRDLWIGAADLICDWSPAICQLTNGARMSGMTLSTKKPALGCRSQWQALRFNARSVRQLG